jgi:hypothetical protein
MTAGPGNLKLGLEIGVNDRAGNVVMLEGACKKGYACRGFTGFARWRVN